MISTILATKLHRPALQSKWVRRPHLIHRLNEGLLFGRQLTLISAPAGFGKTTCTAEWLNSQDLPAAWLSLDKSDDDSIRFFTYFVAALQKVDPTLGREIESVLASGQLPPAEVLVTTLMNDILNLDKRFILILDDFQEIQDRAILEVLARLLNNQPSQLHIVLITREDPLLPLARLRANNQMTEIRASDLRFNAAQVDQFLNTVMGLSLSEPDIAALENRTEGWVVGLQLAGLSMRGRTDPSNFIASLNGSHRYILSYLTEEVLSRQSQEIQSFLLQTSILDKLNGDLCDTVTGRSDSAVLLERLLNANLFLIPLDDEQHWYRYHKLFADLLRSQQLRIHKEQVAQLHQRASQGYEAAGLPGDAIAHALSATDYARAVRLLETYAMSILTQGYAKTVESWMQDLPPAWHLKSPKVNLAFAWMHLLRGSYARITPFLKQAEDAISALDPSAEDAAALRAEWLTLQANLLNVRGKAGEGVELAKQALQAIQPEDDYLRSLAYLGLGGSYRVLGDYPHLIEAYQLAIQNSRACGNLLPEMMAVSALTLMAIQHGQLQFAVEIASPVIERIERSGSLPPPIAASVYGSLGLVLYEWNQLDQARTYFMAGLHLSSLVGHNAGIVYSKIILARLLQAEGDLKSAVKLTEEAAALLQFGIPAWLRPEIPFHQVCIYLAQNNPSAAETALIQYGLPLTEIRPVPEHPIHPAELAYLAGLRLILYQSREQPQPVLVRAGIQLADQLFAEADTSQRKGIMLQTLLLRALLQSVLGDSAASLNDLKDALELARPEGYIRTFVDEDPALVPLLKRSLEQGIQPEYIRKLLAAFSSPELTPAAPPSIASLVEPLTERELEVLRLIAEGLKYEEVATRLVITLNTVRFYVKEIYSKLNVNNRTRAVETARQLALL